MIFPDYAVHFSFHIIIILLLTLSYCSSINNSNVFIVDKSKQKTITTYAILLMITVCLRDIEGYGDTGIYTSFYENMSFTGAYDRDFFGSDWLFGYTMWAFSQAVPPTVFYSFVAIIYFYCHMAACKLLVEKRNDLMLLCCLSAFSFFTYSTNGIRNGVACSMMILALALFISNDMKKLSPKIIALMVVAFFCHKSTALPLASMIACRFYTNTKNLIYFWFFSIGLSLVAGSAIEGFFAGLGFDDRMAAYSQDNHEYDYMFSNTGFRWDFLLYSFMPIWLGYYIVFKRGISDAKYSFLLNTYILCNSFWVMVIRSSSSNRFAYLSWFLYPIVLAYPLLTFPVFKTNNAKKVSYCIMAHTGFTFLMWLMGKA